VTLNYLERRNDRRALSLRQLSFFYCYSTMKAYSV